MGRRGPKPQYQHEIEIRLTSEDMRMIEALAQITKAPLAACARELLRMGARHLWETPPPERYAYILDDLLKSEGEA